MSKPIFEPGDFELAAIRVYQEWCENSGTTPRLWSTKKPWDSQPDVELCEWERDDYRSLARTMLQWAEYKLFSLGIDAETPEKVKYLNESLTYLSTRASEQTARADRAQLRVNDLERKLSLVSDSNVSLVGRLDKLERENARLERMIAEAPVVYELSEAKAVWFHTPRRRDYGEAVRSAKLVQIEEI